MVSFQQMDFLHAVAGLLVGLLVGLTGVGGGSLMTPLLFQLLGVSPQTAVGTDLRYAKISKTADATASGSRNTVDRKIVRSLACGSIPAAIVTLAALSFFGKIGRSPEHLILFSLAVLLAITSLAVLLLSCLITLAQDLDPLDPPFKILAGTTLFGAVIGIALTISSVGAGAIGMAVLRLLDPRLPDVRMVGSHIGHALPLARIAGTGHWLIGAVDATLLINLLVGSIPGVVVGSLLSPRASARLLQPLLALVLALFAWQLGATALADVKSEHTTSLHPRFAPKYTWRRHRGLA